MKKMVIFLGILVIGLSFTSEKKYKVEFSKQEYNLIMYVIDQSNAPHLDVQAAQKIIYNQVAPQIESENKTDSTKQKKN